MAGDADRIVIEFGGKEVGKMPVPAATAAPAFIWAPRPRGATMTRSASGRARSTV